MKKILQGLEKVLQKLRIYLFNNTLRSTSPQVIFCVGIKCRTLRYTLLL